MGRARAGGGPSLIEVKTDRLWGHFEGDMDAYRTDGFKADMADRDAIAAFGRRLAEEGVLNEEEQQSITSEQHRLVEEAIDFARTSPEPTPEDALLHVFA
jgi:pyruvate dehydrogenase E1 component alpha subunit